MTDKVKIASGISLVAGLWLMVSAFVMAVGIMSNEFAIGLLVALLALVELSASESAGWLGWVNSVLGLWLMIAPLFFVGMAVGATWNSVILGLIILVSSLWGVTSSTTMGSGHMGHPKMG
jgi:hypothetical protein